MSRYQDEQTLRSMASHFAFASVGGFQQQWEAVFYAKECYDQDDKPRSVWFLPGYSDGRGKYGIHMPDQFVVRLGHGARARMPDCAAQVEVIGWCYEKCPHNTLCQGGKR